MDRGEVALEKGGKYVINSPEFIDPLKHFGWLVCD
jgi:hypothetical protein